LRSPHGELPHHKDRNDKGQHGYPHTKQPTLFDVVLCGKALNGWRYGFSGYGFGGYGFERCGFGSSHGFGHRCKQEFLSW
jgi:hypothetical protein